MWQSQYDTHPKKARAQGPSRVMDQLKDPRNLSICFKICSVTIMFPPKHIKLNKSWFTENVTDTDCLCISPSGKEVRIKTIVLGAYRCIVCLRNHLSHRNPQ